MRDSVSGSGEVELRGIFSIFAPYSSTMSRKSPILFLLLAFLLNPSLSAQPEKRINWEEEIGGLGRELASRHPDLFFSTDSTAFFTALDRVAGESDGQSVLQVSVRLQQVVAGMGDANTLINYHFNIDNQLILPLECYWFEDGLYILRTRKDYAELLGKRIIAINQHPLQQVIDSLSTLITDRNPSRVKNDIPRMITWTQLLQTFGFAKTSHLELLVEDPAGKRLNCEVKLPARESEMIRMEPDSLPLGWQDMKAFFWDRYLPGEKIYFIQYNKCWSREAEESFGSGASALFMPSFREFEKKVIQTIRKEEIHKMVLDLRFNAGGSSFQGTRLIKKLGRTNLSRNGKVYLVVGRKTSSSAIINAVDLMNTFQVVIVGENSGGKPNHFGEARRFVMTRSNIIVNYSTEYFKLLEEDLPAIVPDIHTPVKFQDFMNGTDPAFETIRNHTPE